MIAILEALASAYRAQAQSLRALVVSSSETDIRAGICTDHAEVLEAVAAKQRAADAKLTEQLNGVHRALHGHGPGTASFEQQQIERSAHGDRD